MTWTWDSSLLPNPVAVTAEENRERCCCQHHRANLSNETLFWVG